MEAVTPFPQRNDSNVEADLSARRPQTLAATATYRLSEQGRKASLLASRSVAEGRAFPFGNRSLPEDD